MKLTKNGEKATRLNGYNGRIYLIEGTGARSWHVMIIEVRPGVKIEDVNTQDFGLDKPLGMEDFREYLTAARFCKEDEYEAGWHVFDETHAYRDHFGPYTRKTQAIHEMREIAKNIKGRYNW